MAISNKNFTSVTSGLDFHFKQGESFNWSVSGGSGTVVLSGRPTADRLTRSSPHQYGYCARIGNCGT